MENADPHPFRLLLGSNAKRRKGYPGQLDAEKGSPRGKAKPICRKDAMIAISNSIRETRKIQFLTTSGVSMSLLKGERFPYLERRKVAIRVTRRHAHGLELRWWWCRSVWCARRSRVILGATPRQANARVADWVALHLVDGHLGGMTLHKLHETTAFSRGDLDVGDLAEALEEGSQLVLRHVSGQTADEDRCVIWVRELVHRLGSTVVTKRRGSTHRVHAGGHPTSHSSRHGHTSWSATTGLVLRSSRGDSHGSVSAVDTLHLGEGSLLITLIGKTNKAISTRHARDGIGHDLGRFARRESGLEERDENVFVDLRAEITNVNGELGASLVAGE